MHQTLFYVPHDLLGAPLLYGWLALGVIAVATILFRQGWCGAAFHSLAMFAIGAAAIYWLIPQLEVLGIDSKNPDGPLTSAGIAVRGYGVFLMLGILAGIGLCQWRARQIGVDPEQILSLCFWLTVFGLIAARLFYVIQKWDTYPSSKSVGEMLSQLFDMTEGGLVVYGSLLGGLVTWIVFCKLNKLSLWKVGDIIAPGMMIGLALGRLGCLMNGCCFGGPCDVNGVGLTFPAGAPAYYRQLETGQLLGLSTESKGAADGTTSLVVRAVVSNSPADKYGIRSGDEIVLIASPADVFVRAIKQDGLELAAIERNSVIVKRVDAPLIVIPVAELPDRSRPAHPTQLYSAINAFLLCCLLWFYYPFRRSDGELMALLLILYSVSRFLEELIRVDEAGVFGTSLTISQWISIVCLAAGALLLFWLRTTRPSTGRSTVAG